MSAMSADRVAAVVVTFHPAADVKARLLRYAGFMGSVIVVDNSEPPAFEAAADFSVANVVYLPLDANLGVAHALNVGAHRAVQLGHELAVLLDQDSDLQAPALELALASARAEHGITALRQEPPSDRRIDAPRQEPTVLDVDTTMTSGSVLNLRAFERCGDFEDKLFIDYVDHDYCLRLKDLGYRVVECQAAILDHALGEAATGHCLGITARFISHRPFRLYYITRNGLYLSRRHGRRYPSAVLNVFKVLAKELVKAMFVEGDKRRRIAFMGRGLRDWLQGRYGKLERS